MIGLYLLSFLQNLFPAVGGNPAVDKSCHAQYAEKVGTGECDFPCSFDDGEIKFFLHEKQLEFIVFDIDFYGKRRKMKPLNNA